MCTTGGHLRQSWPYIVLECFKHRLHSLWCSLENGFLLKQLIKTFYNILLVCHLLSFLHLVFLQKNSTYEKSKDSNEWWIIKQVQNFVKDGTNPVMEYQSHLTKKEKTNQTPCDKNKTWESTILQCIPTENQNKVLLEILILEARKVCWGTIMAQKRERGNEVIFPLI